MKTFSQSLLLALSFWLVSPAGWSQTPTEKGTKYTISGHVTDVASGEELIGASILVKELGTGTVTNLYGFYSLTLPAGTYNLTYTFVGFRSYTKNVELTSNTKIDLEMTSNSEVLKEVEIKSEREDLNVESVEMSTVTMKMQTIEKIPALMGEIDVIKAIQLMPGVATVGEGTSGFYVRGGGVDQNMILLDESPVYNASHLLGFFSVFNSDAIKEVQLFKGGIPAEYGGRLSSVLDVRMKNGNNKRFGLTGGIGTISSRLTAEGPFANNRGSFMLSGRRTYADIFLLLSGNEDLRSSRLFFYDLNTKANYKLNDRNRIFVSGYFGRDTFKESDEFKISWGNATGTIRWNHLFSEKLFSNLTLIYSDFDYFLGAPSGAEAFEWNSKIRDYAAKLDFNYFANPQNTIKFGVGSTYHRFSPGVARGVGDETIYAELRQDDYNALEHVLYVSNEQKITSRLSAQYGIRYSIFQNIGGGTIYNFDENYQKIDSTVYSSGDIFNTYHGPEPRLGLKYTLTTTSSVKASYNRTRQYLHLASNSTSASPLDVWLPSTPNIKPQIADQVALGYFRNFKSNMYEASVEGYYKDMDNVVDFKDHAQLLLNPRLEGEIRAGRAWAYGLEFLVRKQKGPLTGWVSYTLSRARRKIDGINEGREYFAKYDKTHDLSVVGSYELNERWNFAANWVYSTGTAVTMPTGRFEYGGIIAPVYSDRNGARLPSYHRLDIAVTLKSKPREDRRWNGEWVFSVYNAYNRKNPFAINFRQEEDNPNETYAEKLYLFPVIPSVTYNFKF